MITLEQVIIILVCMGGCSYTSYKAGFKQGGMIHGAVYMAVVEEFLSRKMGKEWFATTFGKDNKIFTRFLERELSEDD